MDEKSLAILNFESPLQMCMTNYFFYWFYWYIDLLSFESNELFKLIDTSCEIAVALSCISISCSSITLRLFNNAAFSSVSTTDSKLRWIWIALGLRNLVSTKSRPFLFFHCLSHLPEIWSLTRPACFHKTLDELLLHPSYFEALLFDGWWGSSACLIILPSSIAFLHLVLLNLDIHNFFKLSF